MLLFIFIVYGGRWAIRKAEGEVEHVSADTARHLPLGKKEANEMAGLRVKKNSAGKGQAHSKSILSVPSKKKKRKGTS